MTYINNFSFKFVLKFKVFQKFKSYIAFLRKSTNEHGVHSPFIYNLVTQCFYKKRNPIHQNSFLKYRNSLLNIENEIEITDFGAGSKHFKGNRRTVKAIVKNAGISKKRASLLIRLVHYFKPQNILELGTSLGLSTYCLHLGNPNTSITTLEGCNETAKIATKQLNLFGVKHQLKVGNFSTTLPEIIKNQHFDFIYFDGNHQKNATISYFNQCLETIHNNSIFIFDDIHWSTEMEIAWDFIKNHPKVTVTIDTYQWGIVFFRKEQKKEHFIVRV